MVECFGVFVDFCEVVVVFPEVEVVFFDEEDLVVECEVFEEEAPGHESAPPA